MSLMSLLFLLLVICIVLWGTRALLAAFAIEDPVRTVIWVIVVLIVLGWVVGAPAGYRFY